MIIISNIKTGYALQDKDFRDWLIEHTESIHIQRIDSHNIWGFQSAHDDMNELENFIRDKGLGAYSFKVTYNY